MMDKSTTTIIHYRSGESWEVDTLLLAEYINTIRSQTALIPNPYSDRKIELLFALEQKRKKQHQEILDSVNEKKGSHFEMALMDYRERIRQREGWF